MSKTILVAMSGGVDSSVAVWLLQQQGYTCVGATMRLHESAQGPDDDTEDARAVARRLGIDHYVFDCREEFSRQVMAPFAQDYLQGLTPNPCVTCNRHIKFGLFLERARELGLTHIATGHYVRQIYDADTGRWHLEKARDLSRDQSYVLGCLNQEQLSSARFPLGELSKDQVRQIAQEQGFVNAHKHDSQDICFVPDGDYAAFLSRYTGQTWPQGEILNQEGQVLGHHQGAIRYTLGQRKGLGVSAPMPLYVCSKSMADNTVTLGPEEALFSRTLLARDWVWATIPALTQPLRCRAKVRYRQQEQWALVTPREDGLVEVTFDEPQRAITPGQAVVLYDGQAVIGGGTIC